MKRYFIYNLLFAAALALILGAAGCAKKAETVSASRSGMSAMPEETAPPSTAQPPAARQPASTSTAAGSEPKNHSRGLPGILGGARSITFEEAMQPATSGKKPAARQPVEKKARTRTMLGSSSIGVMPEEMAPAARDGRALMAANGHAAAAASSPPTDEDYKAKLSVDEVIKMPGTGRMTVWIGDPAYMPADRPGMVTDEAPVPAIGESARIIPYAPEFELDRKESDCLAIYPKGIEEIFTLKPTRAGLFNVGAKVHLYRSSNCTGDPYSNLVPTMQVTVKVNVLEPVKSSFWEHLREWMIGIIALFFVVLTLLLKKKIKKLFGISVD